MSLQEPLVVVGLDLSLGSTGVARCEVDEAGRPEWRTWQVRTDPLPKTPPPSLAAVHARISDSAARVWRAVVEAGAEPDLVVVESPALGGGASRQGGLSLTGHWWLVLDPFLQVGWPVATLSPSSLKVYVTGFGGSPQRPVTKAVMRSTVEQRYPGALTGGVHDVAEAVALAAVGARALGRPTDALPDIHVRALDRLKLPDALRRNEIGA